MNVLLLLPLLALTLVPMPPHSGFGAVWPLEPPSEVVRRFDPPAATWLAGHRGVDLLGASGQEVHAALGGTVAFAGTLAGRGVVVVTHGAERTTYEPVEAAVRPGDAVATGDVLGRLQPSAASHCLPRTCLHWGRIRNVDDTYLDPLALLGLGSVRLLPLAAAPVGGLPGRSPPWVLAAVVGALRPEGAPAGRRVAGARW